MKKPDSDLWFWILALVAIAIAAVATFIRDSGAFRDTDHRQERNIRDRDGFFAAVQQRVSRAERKDAASGPNSRPRPVANTGNQPPL